MINVTITIEGLDKALNQIDAYKRVFSDFSTEAQAAGDYLLDFLINDVFNTEGSTYGSRWKPLTSQYLMQKMKKWGSTNILIASGQMRSRWKLYTASDGFIVVNDSPIASYHQNGTEKMAQRVLLKLDNKRLNKIRDIIVDSLNKRVRGSL